MFGILINAFNKFNKQQKGGDTMPDNQNNSNDDDLFEKCKANKKITRQDLSSNNSKYGIKPVMEGTEYHNFNLRDKDI